MENGKWKMENGKFIVPWLRLGTGCAMPEALPPVCDHLFGWGDRPESINM